jgi:hypothetical protein
MIAQMLLAAGCVSGGLVLFPYTVYPLALGWAPRRPVRLRACRAPSATLVFCAYNESASIPAKIENVRAIRRIWPAMQFRCFVDHSSDDTLDLLRAASDILHVEASDQRVGKATGMQRLVTGCDTDIIIFTDANVLVDPHCIPRLLAYFSDPEVGGLCGTLRYANPDASDAALTSSAYWRLEEVIKARESTSGSTMGADGAIFATRRELYPEVPPQLLDDLIVSMTVVFEGRRLVSAPEVSAYESAATDSRDEIQRRRRIACRAYMTHIHIWPRVRAMAPFNIVKYVCHKLIRWYGVWFALAGLALFALGVIAASGPRVGVPIDLAAAALIALALSRARRPVRRLREAALQFWATGLGMADAWMGREYRVWNTPAARAPVPMSIVTRTHDGRAPVSPGGHAGGRLAAEQASAGGGPSPSLSTRPRVAATGTRADLTNLRR